MKKVVAFGECGKDIASVAKKYNYDVEEFEKMEDATKYVRDFACEKDVVLFSPACASFDEFSSYAARGQRFRELILGQE